MKLTAALVCTLPLWIAPESASLRFAPEAKSSLQKTFRGEVTLAFEELSSNMNGQEVPRMYLPVMDIQVQRTFEVSVLDRYERVGEGRPLAFERTFETAEGETEQSFTMEPDTDEHATLESTSRLEGVELSYVWDADEEEYQVSYADGSESDERLDGLVGDMDLLAFLPDEEEKLEEGHEWEVDGEAMRALFEPGGDLAWTVSGDVDQGKGPENYELEGTISATFVGIEESGAARIELAGVVTQISEETTDLEMIPVADGTATEVVTVRIEVSGALLWDVEANHVHSLELECPLDMSTVITKDPDQEGPDFDSTVLMLGTWRFEVEVGDS